MTWRELLGRARPHDYGETLRWLFLHNAGTKLLSVVVAVGLWFFVNAGERDTEISLQVPVELRNIPPTVMLVSPRVDFVDVVVRGPGTLLQRIHRDSISVPLDLRGVRTGPAVLRIMAEALDLPRGVAVVRLTPSEITLQFAAKMRKRVPVRVPITGKAPAGLRVTGTKVAPESIEVVGPAGEVDAIKSVDTAPIDLAEASPGLIERELPLEAPPEYVSFSATLVHAQVTVEEARGTRTVADVPVVVRNCAFRTALQPASIRITVRGPVTAIEALELDHGAVYVDAGAREPGTYRVTPVVDLPGDVELVNQEPALVQLRVLPSRRRGG